MIIETIPNILKELVLNTNSSSAVLTSIDGLTLISEFKHEIDKDRYAASTAALTAIAQNMIKENNAGELQQITIQTNDGNIIIQSISDKVLISLFTEKDIDIKKISEKINLTVGLLNKSSLAA